MNFLVDAQLPRRLAKWLSDAGCNAAHTLDLPNQNRSTDEQILEFVERDQRVLVTKDDDFVNSHLLSGRPAKLLLVSTGNITNRELEQLVTPLVTAIVAELQGHSFLELGREGLITRG